MNRKRGKRGKNGRPPGPYETENAKPSSKKIFAEKKGVAKTKIKKLKWAPSPTLIPWWVRTLMVLFLCFVACRDAWWSRLFPEKEANKVDP